MAYKDKEKQREYYKAYYQAHKNEKKAWYQEHREERKAQMKAYYQAHKNEMKAWYQEHKEERKAYHKDWVQAHREERKAYNKAYQKAYKKSDTNSSGHTKNSVRLKSHYYLFKVLKHTKLDGYEIHHCFGYDDYRNFIYIPKSLHLQIHQFLRDNNIDADTDHYSKIAHLVVAWDGYVYIKA